MGCLIGLAALTSTPSLRAQEQLQTKAERAMTAFPDTLPGAAKVEKYPVQNAQKVLVHVRNIHDGWYGHGRLPTNHAAHPYMCQTQEEIYQILTNLVSTMKINTLYSEGQVGDNFAEDALADERTLVRDREKKDLESYASDRYRTDVVGRIILTKEVHTRGTESPQALQRGYDVAAEDNITLGKFVKYVVDGREDGVLERLSEHQDPLAVLVYGGGHCFGGTMTCGPNYRKEMSQSNDPLERVIYAVNKDNIAAWNALHPKNKVALIEVIPQSLRAYDDFVGRQETRK